MVDVNITVTLLTPADLDAVDELMRLHSNALGFLPKVALCEYLQRGGVLGAKIDDQLVGYVLYGKNRDYFRICQLCVIEQYRGHGIARRLLDSLKASATTQKLVKLHCRRDFQANDIWPKLGFAALHERPGRSKEGYALTLWCLTLAPNDQLSLFQAKTSDDRLDIVIDAQIFFDLNEPDNDKTKPSKALFSDFMVDSLKPWITDELFNEIDRQEDQERRSISRKIARNFPTVEPDRRLAEYFEGRLKDILPINRSSQESDIRQLAKASASRVKTFVTRDHELLKRAEKIADLTGLNIVNPVNLVVELHELSARQLYVPENVVGSNLRWHRLRSTDLDPFQFDSFLEHQEKRGNFRQKLEPLIARPDRYTCELLRSGNDIIAIRVLKNAGNKVLIAFFARVARLAERSLFGRFLIADTISKAIEENMQVLEFEASGFTPSLIPDLLDMGFVDCEGTFVRFCFSSCLDRNTTLGLISELCPESASEYRDMPHLDLERVCSPLALRDNCLKNFLVPIRPGYAISLFDRRHSANDLFGGKKSVLLRWENVYYRQKSHHRILKPPARILWYVSGDQKKVVAMSHLDAVKTATPKALFKDFKKLGIFEWRDVYDLCGGDLNRDIMALRFSHTFLLRAPISLKKLRDVFREDRVGLTLQSPSSVPATTFQRLFELGYPSQI